MMWWTAADLNAYHPFSLFSSENNIFWENSPTQMHGGTDWAFMRLLSLQAVAMWSRLAHQTISLPLESWADGTPGSEMLEPVLPAPEKSFYEFLLHTFPLHCFRSMPFKTWWPSFSFLFSTEFLCGLTWSKSIAVGCTLRTQTDTEGVCDWLSHLIRSRDSACDTMSLALFESS